MSDKTVVADVIDRVPGASDFFVDRFSRFVYFILRGTLGAKPDLADDLHNQVFLKLFEDDLRRLRNWSGEGNFVNYLGPIVRNQAHDHFRRLKLLSEVSLELRDDGDDTSWSMDPVSTDPSPEEVATAAEQRRLLYQALDELSERDREIIRRRHLEEQSYETIAGEMGYKISGVGVLLARAEKRLKKFLDEFPGGDGLAPAM
jgi:RNA polymerase sigma factor (sigma-70 family)